MNKMLMKNCREIPSALVPYSQEHHHKFVCLVLTMTVMFKLSRKIVMLSGSDGKVKDVRGIVIWEGIWEGIFWRKYLMDLALIQLLFFELIIFFGNLITRIFSKVFKVKLFRTIYVYQYV